MDGVLLLDKPLLYTSHDLVDQVRRKLNIRRVGHAGSLDPLANGLVVCLVGEATRLFDRLVSDDKHYTGMITLGLSTDTQDLEGRILRQAEVSSTLGVREVRAVFESMLGIHEQAVPRFSSAKINGRKCYEMARKNIAFTPPTKRVEIRSLKLEAFDSPNAYFSATVSKGTYMRALGEEIGAKLKLPAVLSSLRRTQCGDYHVSKSITLAAFNGLNRAEALQRISSAPLLVP